MISNYGMQWLIVVVLLMPTANLQIPMPMYMPPMPPPMPPMMPQMFGYAPPPPPPVALPFPASPPIAFQIVQIQESKKTSTSVPNNGNKNSKEEKTVGIAIPMSFPAPMQFSMPGFPIPPFCSGNPSPRYCPPTTQEDTFRVHQYRRQPEYIPPMRKAPPYSRVWKDKNFGSSDFQSTYSAEWAPKNRHKRKKERRYTRRSASRKSFDSEMNYDDFAKPVLSYISNDGDIKLEKRLSDDEAAELMDDNKFTQRVQVVTGEDSGHKQSVKVISNIDKSGSLRRAPNDHPRRQVLLRSGAEQHMLGEGKKELIFKPPSDKRISNLSVSFQIT